MLKHLSFSALLFLLLLFGAHYTFADIYVYVNEAGETSIADNLESVPEKYRATAVNTTGREEQKQVSSSPQSRPQTIITTPHETPRQEPARKMTFTSRLLMTVVVVLVWLLARFAINRTDIMKGREQVLPAARIALACFLLVYLVQVHGEDVVNLFTMAGNKIEAVRERQAQQGRKVSETIKALNKLMDEAGKQPPPTDPGEEKGR